MTDITLSDKLTFEIMDRERSRSDFDWINIDLCGTRIGKIRSVIDERRLIINSLYIFSEFKGRGYGAGIIDKFKREFETIIADRVRPTARGFWRKMGFKNNHDGTYIWNNSSEGES